MFGHSNKALKCLKIIIYDEKNVIYKIYECERSLGSYIEEHLTSCSLQKVFSTKFQLAWTFWENSF